MNKSSLIYKLNSKSNNSDILSSPPINPIISKFFNVSINLRIISSSSNSSKYSDN